MYYDHNHWESKIRKAAVQRGDNEILAMSSAEMQEVIKEIEKDYPFMRKKVEIMEKKHLNIYSKAQLCAMLCNATKEILEAYAKALQNDWIKQYVFSFSKTCDITYDADLHRFYNATFTVYDNEDILIEIDTYHMEVLGYVAYHLIAIEELEQNPAKILYDAAQKAWNAIKSALDISEFSSLDEDLMTVNILPYLNR